MAFIIVISHTTRLFRQRKQAAGCAETGAEFESVEEHQRGLAGSGQKIAVSSFFSAECLVGGRTLAASATGLTRGQVGIIARTVSVARASAALEFRTSRGIRRAAIHRDGEWRNKILEVRGCRR